MIWTCGAHSDIGRRRNRNEDAVLVEPACRLYAVADGMGGHPGGDVASRVALDGLRSAACPPGDAGDDEKLLRAGFTAAQATLAATAAARPALAGMGTTLTALQLDREGHTATLAHIGDSRAYLLRAGRLRRLTRDHTWVQEQIDAGVLSAAQARSHPWAPLLTRVLSTPDSVDPDVSRIELLPADVLLLCTDGLTGLVDEDRLAALLRAHDDPARVAQQLVHTANEHGGFDNISVIVLRSAA
jgi:PPM family protein phosphatase